MYRERNRFADELATRVVKTQPLVFADPALQKFEVQTIQMGSDGGFVYLEFKRLRTSWQCQLHQQATQILACIQLHRPAVNLGHIANDGKAQPRPGLARIQPGAAIEDSRPFVLRDPCTVILDPDYAVLRLAIGIDGDDA